MRRRLPHPLPRTDTSAAYEPNANVSINTMNRSVPVRTSQFTSSSWTSIQRARQTLYDQRETARRALLHQQGEFLAATHQNAAVARQNFVNLLARNDEAQNYRVQTRVRRLEHEVDTRFPHRQRKLLSRFSQEANQALEDQRAIVVTEVTAEVWRDETNQ